MVGAIIQGDTATVRRVAPILESRMFYNAWNREIYESAVRLVDRGVSPDPIAVYHELQDRGSSVELEYLSSLLDAVPTAANVEYHATIVRGRAAQRHLISAAERARAAAQNGGFVDAVSDLALELRNPIFVAPQQDDDPLTLAEWVRRDSPLPNTVVRRDSGSGAVLVAGQSALLSGAGGSGKSTMALQIAMARAAATHVEQLWGSTCGLQVAAGPTVMATWEDDPRLTAHRCARIAACAARCETDSPYIIGIGDGATHWTPERVTIMEGCAGIRLLGMRNPLFSVQPGEPREPPTPAQGWRTLWDTVDDAAPDGGALVIIDPVTGGAFFANPNDIVHVRTFLAALAEEAAPRKAAVLLVTHSNKLGRKPGAEDADHTAGSAAWHDGARGVLAVTKDHKGDGPRARVLRCTKANYGAAWWTIGITSFRHEIAIRTYDRRDSK